MINEEIIGLFISKDQDRGPLIQLDDVTDIYFCKICGTKLMNLAGAFEHQEEHPQANCELCNRRIYDNTKNEDFTGMFRVCWVCRERSEALQKTWMGKYLLFKYTLLQKLGRVKK